MAEVTFQKATLEHAQALAPLLTDVTLDEVRASHGVDARLELANEVARSDHAIAMFLGGEIAAIFGLMLHHSDTVLGPRRGCMWLVTGQAVAKYPLAFFKGARRVLAAFIRIAPRLSNWIDVRDASMVRVFTRLGFAVGPETPHGINGEPFRLVVVDRSNA